MRLSEREYNEAIERLSRGFSGVVNHETAFTPSYMLCGKRPRLPDVRCFMFNHCIEKRSRLSLLLITFAFLWAGLSLNLRGQDRLKTAYETAQQLFQQGKDAEARVHFQALLAEIYRARAALYRQPGLWARVQADLEAVVDLRPDNDPDLYYDLADAYFRQANYLQAARKLEALTPEKPGDAKVHGLLGRAYFSLGKLDAARRELQTAQNLDPTDSLTAYTLALVALSQKDRETSARIFSNLGKHQGFSPHFHVLAGRAYLDTNFHAEAQRELHQALRLDSKSRFAHYLLALSLLRERETAALGQAKEELSQELELFPDEFASRYLLGLVLEFERHWQKAAEAFQRSVALAPNEPDAHFHLGNAYLKLGRGQQAAESLHRALALTNKGGQSRFQAHRAHYLLSQAYRTMGDLKASALAAEAARSASSQLAENERKASEAPTLQAMLENLRVSDPSVNWQELTRVCELSPNQESMLKVYAQVLTNGHNYLGLIAVRQQQFDEAARQFSRVAELQPDFPDADLNLGIALFQAEEYAKALEPLTRHLKRNPSQAVIRKYLGLTYFQQEQYDQAAKLLQEVRTSDPQDAQVLLALGTSLVRLHQTEEAQKIFTELLKSHPDSAPLHVLWGQAYAGQDQPQEAEKEFRRALELDPKVSSAHFSLGIIYLRRGALDEAGREFAGEIGSHPKDSRARYHLAFIRLTEQKLEEAVSLLRQVIQDAPNYAEAHYSLGKAFLQEGHVPEAIERLETAVRLDPGKAYSHYQLGRAYQKAGRNEQAQQQFEIAQKLKAQQGSKRSPAEESP